MFTWDWFIRATSTRSLYLLGSGASYPEIGKGDSLSKEVRKRFWENGVYPILIQPTSPLKSAILRPNLKILQQNCLIEQAELDARTPFEFIEVTLAQLLTNNQLIFPPQYRVFDYFHPSVIFNFNNDNLADKMHPKHEMLYPHGKIAPIIAHLPYMNEAIKLMSIPQSINKYFDYWRPIPELSSITEKNPYRRLIDIFPTVNCVCIIGYSFGTWAGGIDDAESLEMIIDLLRWKPKPVLIVDPNSEHLAEIFRTVIQQISVYELSCKWNVLANFIIKGCFQRVLQTSRGSLNDINAVYKYYEYICNIKFNLFEKYEGYYHLHD